VAAEFARLGAALVDADAVAHALTAPGGAAIAPIRAAFGDDAIAADGRLDRARMRALAFDDPGARRRLEAILHPMIRAEMEARIAAAHAGGAPYVLLEVPLLVESGGWVDRVDRVLVVDCDEARQLERVERRSGLPREQALAILRAQASRGERLARAHDVVDNDGDPAAIAPQVARLHGAYLRLAAAGPDARGA
jgi:dephospho-CoA kinase